MFSNPENDFIQGNGLNYLHYESTVENIVNSIIYHEWYSHLICNVDDGGKYCK